MATEKMAATLQRIGAWLAQRGWRYQQDADRGMTVVEVDTVDNLQVVILLEEDGEMLRVVVPQVATLAAHPHREAALETLLRLGWELKRVRWQVDPSDGEVRATAEIPLEDGELTDRQFWRTLEGTIDLVTRVAAPRLHAVLETGTDPGSNQGQDLSAVGLPNAEAALGFLQEMVQVVLASQGNPAQVYPFFQANLEKLDEGFLGVLQALPDRLQANPEAMPQELALAICEFGNLIQQFPLGNRAVNLELAIASYAIGLMVFPRQRSPETWAAIQNSLANAYSDRIRGDRAENLEAAIHHYQQALEVRTRKDFPVQWATTENNLAAAYSDRIRGDRAENLEAAIHHYQQALAVYTRKDFPVDWAMTENNLANAYLNRIRGDRAENLEAAIHHYQQALEVYTRKDFPVQWATTENNLANAYAERIRGDRAENLEAAIHHYQQALAVLQPGTMPLECLKAARGLGDVAFTQGDWHAAIEGYTTAVEAVEQSRSWATTEERRQEILAESIGTYEKLLQACINAQRLDLALQTVERVRSKRLVDLMASADLYGDGQVPPEVREKLEAYEAIQRQIDDCRDDYRDDCRADGSGRGDRALAGSTTRSRTALAADSAAIEALEAQKQTLRQQLGGLDAVSAGLLAVKPLSLAAMQALNDSEETALLSFYTTDDDTHIFVLRGGQLHLHTCPGEGLKRLQHWLIEQWVTPYIAIAAAKDTERQAALVAWMALMPGVLAQLAERLQLAQLVQAHLTGIRELILIPHLFLHQIPFAALPLEQGYLGERFALRYAPGCQVLKFCQEREPIAGMANTLQYGTVENATDDLPCAAFEGDGIAKLFAVPDDLRLRGRRRATVAEYRRLLERVQGIVSSHHAQSRFDNPLESKLLLGDGSITLGQLLSPGWRFPQLADVFLSCCETGLHLPSNLADELLTLGTGFLCAGARSVVSTLWAVDDLATALFSIFYHQQRQSCDRVTALQNAQQHLRHLTGKELKTHYADNLMAALETQFDDMETLRAAAEDRKETFAPESPDYAFWQEEETHYHKITNHIDSVMQSLELHCQAERQTERPFEHPLFWGAFVCQGLR